MNQYQSCRRLGRCQHRASLVSSGPCVRWIYTHVYIYIYIYIYMYVYIYIYVYVYVYTHMRATSDHEKTALLTRSEGFPLVRILSRLWMRVGCSGVCSIITKPDTMQCTAWMILDSAHVPLNMRTAHLCTDRSTATSCVLCSSSESIVQTELQHDGPMQPLII